MSVFTPPVPMVQPRLSSALTLKVMLPL